MNLITGLIYITAFPFIASLRPVSADEYERCLSELLGAFFLDI